MSVGLHARPWVEGRGNPFSSRYTAPGRLPPLSSDGRPVDLAALVARLPHCGLRALVGPHGSGKTTLLLALVGQLGEHGRPVHLVRVTARRSILTVLQTVGAAADGAIVAIDSWERLGLGARSLVRLCAARRGCVLLVTAHRAGRLPILATCTTTPRLLTALVDLLPGGEPVAAADVTAAFSTSAGDLREAFGRLYDHFESRRGPAQLPIGT